MERWDSCILRDILDVIAATNCDDFKNLDYDPISPTGNSLNGKMSPRKFHRTIAKSGDKFYKTVKRKTTEPTEENTADDTEEQHQNDSEREETKNRNRLKIDIAQLSSGPSSPSIKSSPSLKSSGWRTKKETSFIFERVLSEQLEDSNQDEQDVQLRKNRPNRSRFVLGSFIVHI